MHLDRGARRTTAPVSIAVLVALVATLMATPSGAIAASKKSQKAAPRVVVAVVDSAVNPYHEFFHSGGSLYGKSTPSSVTPAVLKEFGITKKQIIPLTRTGNFAADFAKDRARFDAIEAGQPYWFKGTNVIGISFGNQGQRLRPDGGATSHGIGTNGSVLAANPDAIVVSVEGPNNDSEQWAFTHPAVDIVSTSYGPITSAPTLNHLSFSYTGAVTNGKAHFGAAANDPTFASLDETSGPWWTFGIAGFQEYESEGKTVTSGTWPDFVADFTQELPYCRNCEEGLSTVSGTSFATPKSAGTFSKILLESRRAAGHKGGIVDDGDQPLMVKGKGFSLSVWDLRRALEQGAYYPGASDYVPGGGGTAVPVTDQAPWSVAGWGVITNDPEHEVIPQTLAHLGVKGRATRTKDDNACRFMTAFMTARHAYWDNVAVLGESFGTSADPYVYC